MTKYLLIILICGLALSATAQLNPEPDLLGVYFDQGATVRQIRTAVPFAEVTAYLVLTHPTDPGGIAGWECAVDVSGSLTAERWEIAAGLNIADSSRGLFHVGIGLSPLCLPPVPTVTLATWRAYAVSTTDPVFFRILPFPDTVSFQGSPGYASGQTPGHLIPLLVDCDAAYGSACATINYNGCGVGAENRSWSEIKALYR